VRLSLLPDEYERLQRLKTDRVPVRETVAVEDTTPVNGQLALLWSPRLDQVLKLSWGTASQDVDQFNLPEDERIAILEANYTLTRPRWMLSAGLFQNRLSNLARTIQRYDTETDLYVNVNVNVNVDDNSGRWRTRGLELIAEACPLPGLDLSASLTWQRTEDRSSGVDPGYSPELLAKLKASWTSGPMTYAAYAHYVDGMDADWDFVSGPEQGAVTRIGELVFGYWNIGLNLRWDPIGAGPYTALNVSNLLDTENRYPANELTDFARGLIGPGRAQGNRAVRRAPGSAATEVAVRCQVSAPDPGKSPGQRRQVHGTGHHYPASGLRGGQSDPGRNRYGYRYTCGGDPAYLQAFSPD
jgi:hypothetical protein